MSQNPTNTATDSGNKDSPVTIVTPPSTVGSTNTSQLNSPVIASSAPTVSAQGNPVPQAAPDGGNLERRGRFTIKNVSRAPTEEGGKDGANNGNINPIDTRQIVTDKSVQQPGNSTNTSSPASANTQSSTNNTTVNPNAAAPVASNIPSADALLSEPNTTNKEGKEKSLANDTQSNPNPEETNKPKEDESKVKKKSRFTVKAVTVEVNISITAIFSICNLC